MIDQSVYVIRYHATLIGAVEIVSAKPSENQTTYSRVQEDDSTPRPPFSTPHQIVSQIRCLVLTESDIPRPNRVWFLHHSLSYSSPVSRRNVKSRTLSISSINVPGSHRQSSGDRFRQTTWHPDHPKPSVSIDNALRKLGLYSSKVDMEYTMTCLLWVPLRRFLTLLCRHCICDLWWLASCNRPLSGRSGIDKNAPAAYITTLNMIGSWAETLASPYFSVVVTWLLCTDNVKAST